MPAVLVKLLEGVFTPVQKQEMVRQVTDAMIAVEGENLRPYTVVIVEEVKSGDWGFGGKTVTTEAVTAMAAGKSRAAG